ncbi:hypothetical protein CEXT_548461 [Caerostris extrusa]|uniref:Uncharacterized protein n=1 Tax=Caerostris extrusa TaxID=172846 RepID=A0AAV4WL98_CAEEX|nr:hypothetical protein CEXT_548461 [Caerostris extrusa]
MGLLIWKSHARNSPCLKLNFCGNDSDGVLGLGTPVGLGWSKFKWMDLASCPVCHFVPHCDDSEFNKQLNLLRDWTLKNGIVQRRAVNQGEGFQRHSVPGIFAPEQPLQAHSKLESSAAQRKDDRRRTRPTFDIYVVRYVTTLALTIKPFIPLRLHVGKKKGFL